MEIKRAGLIDCGKELDAVVVIDVIRAFTTAAFAFEAGVREIIVAGEVSEALNLGELFPDALVMGEVNGRPVEDFDLGNSPAHVSAMDLRGRRLIHRTTAGTQGVVRSSNAAHILATGLCCVTATAARISEIDPQSLTLVQTGLFEGGWGDEDVACADLLEGLLSGEPPPIERIIDRVRSSRSGSKYVDYQDPVFPATDLDLAVDVDRFDFAMEVSKRSGLLVLQRVR